MVKAQEETQQGQECISSQTIVTQGMCNGILLRWFQLDFTDVNP